MRRADLEHVIRAAADIADDDEVVIIGSQAVLGQYPDAPPELRVSMEADLWPRNRPELAAVVDGCIGEGSAFHEMYGYYAQGVGPETARLPRGWERRLIRVQNENTRRAIGWCLEAHDLALSKYAAGRDKDLDFTRVMVKAGMLDRDILMKRLPTMNLEDPLRRLVEGRIHRHFTEGTHGGRRPRTKRR